MAVLSPPRGDVESAPRVPGRIERVLGNPHLPAYLALVALLLSAPSLGLGLRSDDQFLRLALMRPAWNAEWARGPADLFAFYRGDPTAIHDAIDVGVAPWWTPPDFRIAFFRPLTGLTHWLDFHLWPDRPWIMHAQSIGWFIAVVVVVTLLYRRMLQPA